MEKINMFLLFLKTMASPPAQHCPHCPTPHPQPGSDVCSPWVIVSSPGPSGYKCSFTARLPCGCCLCSQLPFQLHLRQVCTGQGWIAQRPRPALVDPTLAVTQRGPARRMPKVEHIFPWLPRPHLPRGSRNCPQRILPHTTVAYRVLCNLRKRPRSWPGSSAPHGPMGHSVTFRLFWCSLNREPGHIPVWSLAFF